MRDGATRLLQRATTRTLGRNYGAMKQMRRSDVKRLLTVLPLSFLAACDPAEIVELRRQDLSPVLCPAAEQTRFSAAFLTRGSTEPEQYSSGVEPRGGALATRPPHPLVGILAGSVEGGRLEWIQFEIFCGDSTKPFLVTPKITPRDLVKINQHTFRYIVDDASWNNKRS